MKLGQRHSIPLQILLASTHSTTSGQSGHPEPKLVIKWSVEHDDGRDGLNMLDHADRKDEVLIKASHFAKSKELTKASLPFV